MFSQVLHISGRLVLTMFTRICVKNKLLLRRGNTSVYTNTVGLNVSTNPKVNHFVLTKKEGLKGSNSSLKSNNNNFPQFGQRSSSPVIVREKNKSSISISIKWNCTNNNNNRQSSFMQSSKLNGQLFKVQL